MRKFQSVLCSPHEPDVFAIGSAESLRLYRFHPHTPSPSLPRSAPATISLVSGVNDLQQMRCMAWSPRKENPCTLATGTAGGKIVLHDCAPAAQRGEEASPLASSTSALREFVPRFQRVCFSVAWNEEHSEHIAAGLDKVRCRGGGGGGRARNS